MPIYEYQCDDCGHRLETMQKISDPPLSDCPRCSKPALVKLVSASAFRLKGGGWYETDFKTGNRRHGTQDSPGAAPSEKGGGKSESGKTESKQSNSSQSVA